MDIKVFREKTFDKGRNVGFSEMELYFTNSRNFSVRIFKNEIDNYSLSDVQGIGFRGKFGGKMGYAYTEILDEESIDLLINDAKQNAEIMESTDEIEVFAGSPEYPAVSAYNPEFGQVPVSAKIEFAFALEEEALKLDPRVETVNYATLSDGEGEIYIANTKGLEQSFRTNSGGAFVSVVVREGDDVRTAGRVVMGNNWSKFDAKALAQGAVEEAISLLGAESVPSKAYPVVLRYDVASSILQTFSSVFSAENVQKGFSLLAGKLGEQIASSVVTLVDDPLLVNGPASRPFDGEGVATKTKDVIQGGVLQTFLHNLKTAKKDGVETTGNASRGSFRSPVGIAPTNFFIQPGSAELGQLLEEMSNGLLIIDVQGLHSGANSISGDFSLGAYGYLVEGGRIARPVDQITIAGNFFELLKDIILIGNDLDFSKIGSIGSPSLLVKSLAVAGK